MIKSEVRNVYLPGAMSLSHALWRSLKRFGNAENLLKTMSLKHAFWQCLKRFRTAEHFLKTMSLNNAFWHLTVVQILWNCREKNENNVYKEYILTMFETIWNCRENFENKDGKWCILTVFKTIWFFYVKTCECLPPLPYVFIAFLDIYLFWLFRKSCRPGPSRPTHSYASGRLLFD